MVGTTPTVRPDRPDRVQGLGVLGDGPDDGRTEPGWSAVGLDDGAHATCSTATDRAAPPCTVRAAHRRVPTDRSGAGRPGRARGAGPARPWRRSRPTRCGGPAIEAIDAAPASLDRLPVAPGGRSGEGQAPGPRARASSPGGPHQSGEGVQRQAGGGRRGRLDLAIRATRWLAAMHRGGVVGGAVGVVDLDHVAAQRLGHPTGSPGRRPR